MCLAWKSTAEGWWGCHYFVIATAVIWTRRKSVKLLRYLRNSQKCKPAIWCFFLVISVWTKEESSMEIKLFEIEKCSTLSWCKHPLHPIVRQLIDMHQCAITNRDVIQSRNKMSAKPVWRYPPISPPSLPPLWGRWLGPPHRHDSWPGLVEEGVTSADKNKNQNLHLTKHKAERFPSAGLSAH